ncbi:MAG: glycosyltransferase [Clostridiaceae bacterium]|nr:glycosyltransferase [Clostridiaceae bacterium]
MTPQISVIMPVYNSAKHLSEAIDSVIQQTFTDWELLVLNEFGSDDGSVEIVQDYQKNDSRFQLVQNEERLGLAESLNKGFRMARGKYLARLDADDLAHPQRFEKQYHFMEEHPEIGICGSYQHHFGPGTDWVHKPPFRPQDMKASLLFNCNLCHSTLMLRRDTILENALFYDNRFLAEDFELWTRAILVTEIANIPEVLGEYRKDGCNITVTKKEGLKVESGQIVANTMKRTLDIDLTERQMFFFQGWENSFLKAAGEVQHRKWLEEFETVLRKIYAQNEQRKVFDRQALLNLIAVEWRHAKNYGSRDWSGERLADSLEEIFNEEWKPPFSLRVKRFIQNNTLKSGSKKALKKLLRPCWHVVKRRLEVVGEQVAKGIVADINRQTDWRIWKSEGVITRKVDARIWKSEKLVMQTMEDRLRLLENRQLYELASSVYQSEKLHLSGKQIQLGILFQMPSGWPSLESVWKALCIDERFNARIFLFEGAVHEQVQMAGAREFLEEQGIPYTLVDRYTFVDQPLHILIYQTPWDEDHRPAFLQSDRIAQLGTRIVYIPYGLNYSASVWLGHRFSDTKLRAYPWIVFTFSGKMRFDHVCFSPRGGRNVIAVGHPKFDAIADKHKYPLEDVVLERVAGRKIVFVQMHFPGADGNAAIPEANIQAYTEFLAGSARYSQFFFLVRPHPKLFEYYENKGMEEIVQALREVLDTQENVFCYDYPDYRPALFAADFVIGDRSALMLEAGAMGVPVLYMTNFYYKEQMLPAVQPLFESFYQGSFAYDIHFFMDFVAVRGNDYKKEERMQAARECLPAIDGQSGKRIVNAMAEAFYREEGIYAGNISSYASV